MVRIERGSREAMAGSAQASAGPRLGQGLFLNLGLLALGLLVLGCGQTEASLEGPPSPPSPPAEKEVSVRSLVLEGRDVEDRASLPADIFPFRRALLAAEVAGAVEATLVNDGDRVRSGQSLVRIDTRSLEQALRQAEAVHRQRQAQFQRAEALLERKSITQQQFLDALTNRDVAVARLESSQLDLERSQIKAPWSGQVAWRKVEVGDYVSPGQGVLELLEVRRLKVRAPAPSADVPFLRPGVPVEIRVDAFPGRIFRAKVTRLGAELDAAARTLDLEVEIDNAGGELKPGMFARLELSRRTLKGAILVPLVSLVDLEDRRVAYVVEEGRARRRELSLGPVIGQEVVVEEGLAIGDRVIVDGQLRVSPGQKVEELEGVAAKRESAGEDRS